MAKIIKYKFLSCGVNHGTEENPEVEQILLEKSLAWNEINEEIARAEAYNDIYTIEDDGVEEDSTPSQLDIIEAQVTYTAMMTDTLLEV
jgi:hypothetical protein